MSFPSVFDMYSFDRIGIVYQQLNPRACAMGLKLGVSAAIPDTRGICHDYHGLQSTLL